ncbi:MAG TPA: Flp family type IVb pilin [Geobacteraceae bacterium]|nr:Flp family type IVb pilin [Geobacteraceae bacterium]
MNYFTALYVRLISALKSEKGQTLVEYALLLVLIAIVVITMLKALGGTTNNAFSTINASLK